MNPNLTRRDLLAWAGAASAGWALRPVCAQEPPKADDHSLRTISGKPRERGREYGRTFKDAIAKFLEREIYQTFTRKAPTREEVLRYAGACAAAIREYSPAIFEELEGMAEGSGLRLEELVAITLHEELGHKGVIPHVSKCTAVAAGPPTTGDEGTYVGQTWDWMASVYGQSQMLLWKRSEGPSVLAYAYPGLWTGAGLNSAGIALCWTSAQGMGVAGPRVGIPSYVLIAQLLYQETLDAAVEEARRARHAGWFTFVLADGKGNLANIEGTPNDLEIERGRGHMARVYFGSRRLTGTAEGKPVRVHPQCRRMLDLVEASKGRVDRAALQGFMGDHESTICKHFGTLDAMVFDCSRREAYVTRGPGCAGRWKKFSFGER